MQIQHVGRIPFPKYLLGSGGSSFDLPSTANISLVFGPGLILRDLVLARHTKAVSAVKLVQLLTNPSSVAISFNLDSFSGLKLNVLFTICSSS